MLLLFFQCHLAHKKQHTADKNDHETQSTAGRASVSSARRGQREEVLQLNIQLKVCEEIMRTLQQQLSSYQTTPSSDSAHTSRHGTTAALRRCWESEHGGRDERAVKERSAEQDS